MRNRSLPLMAPDGKYFLQPFAASRGLDENTVRNWLIRLGYKILKSKPENKGQPRRAISKHMAEEFLRYYGKSGLPTMAEWITIIKATGGPAAGGWRNVADIIAAADAIYELHKRDIYVTPEGAPKPEEWGAAVQLLGEKLGRCGRVASSLRTAA